MKRALILALKVAVVALLLAYMARSLNALDLKRLEAVRSGWGWIVLAQLFISAMLFLSFYRWKLLLSAQGIHYSLRDTVALGFIGFFFSQFIPGATGGDLVKAYYVTVDHPERRAAGVTTVFLDRAVGLLVLVGIAAAAIVLNWPRIRADPSLRFLAALVAAILLGCAAAGILFFSLRFRSSGLARAVIERLPFRDILLKVQGAVYVYKFHPRLVVVVLLLSLVVQLSSVAVALSYALALQWKVGPETFLFIVPLAHLALAVPTGSPGGLGQSEFAYSYLFHQVGYPDGFLLALMERVNWALWGLWGSIYYFRRRGRVRRAMDLASAEESGVPAPLGEVREARDPRPESNPWEHAER